MRRRSVIRDTIQMTVIQFFLECLALLFNAWMTRRVGAATVGTLALAGSFFNLAAMVAGGNAMLCASRFVSEELGKSCGCPAQILRNAVRFCLLLSVPVSAGIFAFAEPLSRQFLQSTAMAQAVRLMALLLPLGSISACLKGYFNAVCRVTVTAGCDVAEFLLRAGLLTGLLLWHRAAKPEQVCTYLVGSMAAGTLFSTAVLLLLYVRKREPCRGKCSLSFGTYIRLAVPVAFGGCLTAALSTANDTLIPMTLRQFGDSTSRALQQFGTFEGIVIPVLFFSVYHSLRLIGHSDSGGCPCQCRRESGTGLPSDRTGDRADADLCRPHQRSAAEIRRCHRALHGRRRTFRQNDPDPCPGSAVYLSGDRAGGAD